MISLHRIICRIADFGSSRKQDANAKSSPPGAAHGRRRTARGRHDKSNTRVLPLLVPFLLLPVSAAIAHTVSVGYENLGGGVFNIWYGTYHANTNFTEGSLSASGPSFSTVVPFTLNVVGAGNKPSGLIDGTTNFYSNAGGTGLTGTPVPVTGNGGSFVGGASNVVSWQGAHFTGITTPGNYTFTYVPIANPSQNWDPINNAILTVTFQITALQLGLPTPVPQTPAPVTTSVAVQSMNSFITQMLNPLIDSRFMPNPVLDSGCGGIDRNVSTEDPRCHPDDRSSQRLGFASDRPASPEMALAYNATRTPAARAFASEPRRWSVWGSTYSGQNRITDDTTTQISRVGGVVAGLDYLLTKDTMVGFAVGAGRTSSSLSNDFGSGSGDMAQAGAYAFHRHGAAYLSGALAFAWHKMSTDRYYLTNHLTADFDSYNLGGRVEGGYRFATRWLGITPYAAVQAQNYRSPSYTETAVSGSSAYAIAYDAGSTTATRLELGTWFDRSFIIDRYSALTLRARPAYAYDHSTDPSLNASFPSMLGSTFVVNGVAPVQNLVLLSGVAELKFINNLSITGRFDGEFSNRSQSYTGMGSLRYTW